MRESTFTNAICKAESKQISKDFAYCEDALGRAENAIGNLPSVQPEKRTEERMETHACDLIDRKAAIDALSHCQTYLFDSRDDDEKISLEDAEYAIEQLPSVQSEIIRCKDCKWYGRADKRRFYRGMDCLQKRIDTIIPDKDFCSKAERREE